MDNLANRVIKGYEMRERVGTGGFGAVYRAYQTSVGREVAVKVILPEHANHPDFIRRFEVEAQLIARIEHPHIVPLYDYWRDPEGAFLVMRWLPTSLRVAINRGSWSAEAAARLLEQISAALSVAHREGVIHRDIKPDNILLDEDDNAYLADFGIAKDLSASGTTQEGMLVGSPAYITPEQIKGELVTSRADIYSLGLVLYEILVSEKPYPEAKTPAELLNCHLNIPLPLLQARRPNLPAALNEVLQTATAKEPGHRYAHALRFAAAFRAALPNIQRELAQPLVEPLTERELDILRLMVGGLSNAEIAQRLYLSAGTVKWYVQQIYTKLDAHSRHQAIQRAQQLNLLEDEMAQATAVPSSIERVPLKRVSTAPPASELINPYKGLRAFQESDAADFFGCAVLTEQLLGRLADGSRFLVVVGPSGSGKSSVVRAGLIPALRRGGLLNSKHWFITEMLPGTHPLEELEAALLRIASSAQSGLLSQLSEDRRGLVRAVKRLLPADSATELVLVIDQFEELFTLLEDETIRTHFIDNLLSAANDPRSRIRIVLTLRADFYDRPLLYSHLAELVRSYTEVVVPLTTEELERAIAGPAERIGLTLEPGLVATMINDGGEQPRTLPLLQYALTELFERRQAVMLTLDAYRASGGISGALARRADELYDDLEPDGQAAARQLFLRLVTLGEGTEDTRRRVLQTELGFGIGSERIMDDVMNAFNQYRLLTFDRDPVTRGPTVEIAHEALIREWKRLREWLNESREDLRVQRRLMAAAAEWANSSQDASFLASGSRLTQFATLASQGDLALNDLEHAYIKASVTAREAQEKEAEARRERELTLARQAAESAQVAAKSQRQSANRLRYLVGALVLFLVIAAGLSVFAFGKQAEAVTVSNNLATQVAIQKLSNSRGLASQALSLVQNNGDPQLAMLLGLYGLQAADTQEAETAVTQAVQFSNAKHANDIEFTVSVTSRSKINSVYSPDNQYFLTGNGYIGPGVLGHDPLVRLWDSRTGQLIRQYEGLTDTAMDVAFSPDGQYVAAASATKNVRVWNTLTAQIQQTLTTDNWSVSAVFSPDGRYVLTGGSDGKAQLWDWRAGVSVRSFRNDDFATAIFSPDGRYILSSSGDLTVRLWDIASGQEIRRFTAVPDSFNHSVFSPDGRYVLSMGSPSGAESNVWLWDAQTAQGIRQFKNATAGAFSADSSHILVNNGNDLFVYDEQTGNQIDQFYSPVLPATLNISRDGQNILVGGANGKAAIIKTTHRSDSQFLSGHTALVIGVRTSPDGKYVSVPALTAPPGCGMRRPVRKCASSKVIGAQSTARAFHRTASTCGPAEMIIRLAFGMSKLGRNFIN